MIKIKYIFVAVLFSAIIFSCKDDVTPFVPFDHAAQAIKDNDSIVKFLKNHYYDDAESVVKELVSGKTALYSDSNLNTKEVTENSINYKLYYYIKDLGTTAMPSKVDSVFVNYSGYSIKESSLGNSFDSSELKWFTLSPYSLYQGKLATNLIKGWTYGISEFKGGTNVTQQGEKIKYTDYGKGVLFIPSGLAYRNRGRLPSIGSNQNLIFYIDLLDSKQADHDKDGISSINEDLDEDGKPWNDDTDGNGIPNYLDIDDDGDGTFTKNEDANKDGDPRNDFSDKDKPNTPDYLNQKIR